MTHMREISSRSRSCIFLALPARVMPCAARSSVVEALRPFGFMLTLSTCWDYQMGELPRW